MLSTSRYDAYGSAVGSSTADPFGYGGQAGYYTDNETGLLQHRYCDPAQGRFLTRDPIGYGGWMNRYGYAGNGPVNGIDPSGYGGASTSVGQLSSGTTQQFAEWVHPQAGAALSAAVRAIGMTGSALTLILMDRGDLATNDTVSSRQDCMQGNKKKSKREKRKKKRQGGPTKDEYERITPKGGHRRLGPKALATLDEKRASGEITSNDIPGRLLEEFPGRFLGVKLE